MHTDPHPPIRMGRGVRVAIVDSGVHPTHPHVRGVAGGVAIDRDGRLSDDYIDRIGHGTAVTAAIKEKAPLVECFAVRIFADRLSAPASVLAAAIEWSANAGMHVVNLSLGTSNVAHTDMFRAVVQRATAAGTLIVAARQDGEQQWLPGILPGVIGVEVDWDCPRHEVRLADAVDSLTFRASGFARPVPGVDPRRNLHGVSFAVANLTGLLCRQLEGRTDGRVEEAGALLQELQDRSSLETSEARLAVHTPSRGATPLAVGGAAG